MKNTLLSLLFALSILGCSSDDTSIQNDTQSFEETLLFMYDKATGYELHLLSGASDTLIKDINTQEEGSDPSQMTALHDIIYFVATDIAHGYELWRTDGTNEGTHLVKDIYAGTISSDIEYLLVFNDLLYFAATDVNGTNLWRSDGTVENTVMVKDFDVRENYRNNIEDMIVYNDSLIISATLPDKGDELFISDGTETGTTLLKDIWEGDYKDANPRYFTLFNSKIYFNARDSDGYNLWETNGTTEGTLKVVSADTNGSSPQYLVATETELFFRGKFSSNGIELLKCDVDNNITLVKDIRVDGASGVPSDLTVFNNKVYFEANDGSNYGLWQSDGTEAGTTLITVIETDSSYANINEMIAIDNQLYFTLDDTSNKKRLFVSDGTESGTLEIFSQENKEIKNLASINNRLFFNSDSDLYGKEIFSSEGTYLTTGLYLDVLHDQTGSSIYYYDDYTTVGDRYFFRARSPGFGYELWVSDGTENGTVLVKDIYEGTSSSGLYHRTSFKNKLYFEADEGVYGDELWVSDGTEGGTYLLKDINSGAEDADISNFTVFNNRLYFTADDGKNGEQLWVSDGTSEGTVIVTYDQSDIRDIIATEESLYFTTGSDKLYKSDGVTVTLIDESTFSYFSSLISFQENVYVSTNLGYYRLNTEDDNLTQLIHRGDISSQIGKFQVTPQKDRLFMSSKSLVNDRIEVMYECDLQDNNLTTREVQTPFEESWNYSTDVVIMNGTTSDTLYYRTRFYHVDNTYSYVNYRYREGVLSIISQLDKE